MLKFIFILCLLLLLFHFSTRKYLNPYKLEIIFGKKGSGKSTTMTKIALQHLKKGWNVYSTVPIPGCILFDVSEFGFRVFPEKSLILIEEAGTVWDSRDFKNFHKEIRDYIRLQRHYKNKVIMLSQSFDLDKRIRDTADSLYLCTCFCRVFSIKRKILKRVTISNGSSNNTGVSSLIEEYKFDLPLGNGLEFTFIPRYVAYFESYDHEKLPIVNGKVIEFNELQNEYLNNRKWFIAQIKLLFIRFVYWLKTFFRKGD